MDVEVDKSKTKTKNYSVLNLSTNNYVCVYIYICTYLTIFENYHPYSYCSDSTWNRENVIFDP